MTQTVKSPIALYYKTLQKQTTGHISIKPR